MLHCEEWRPVYGYEGLYEVSDSGLVRHLRTGRTIRPSLTRNGYEQINLRGPSGVKNHMVHRLVLSSFVGPCPVGMECCHGDGDKRNNSLANLRWDTKAANMADRDAHGKTRRGGLHSNAKLSDEQVKAILKDRRTLREIAGELGVALSTVGRIRQGINWAHAQRP